MVAVGLSIIPIYKLNKKRIEKNKKIRAESEAKLLNSQISLPVIPTNHVWNTNVRQTDRSDLMNILHVTQ